MPHAFAQLCPLTGCLTGNLYVADSFFDTVRQYNSAGVLLDANFITGLISANDIAFDSAGNLYVLDTGHQTVRQYDSAGTLLDANFITGLDNPRSFAFDSAGNLYVLDTGFGTVRQYDSAGALLDAKFITGLSNPRSIAFDSPQIPDDDIVDTKIAGTLIPIDTTTLLLASVQSISMWMIPVVAAGVGIGIFVIKRRK